MAKGANMAEQDNEFLRPKIRSSFVTKISDPFGGKINILDEIFKKKYEL